MISKDEGQEEDEDVFEDSFQIESQLLHAVKNIEKDHRNHRKNNEIDEIEDVGNETLAAMCLEPSRSVLMSVRNSLSNQSIKENVKSPKFASTPTNVGTEPRFTTAKKLSEIGYNKLEKTKEVEDNIKHKHEEPEELQSKTDDASLQISGWGLPESVVDSYHDRGIRTMFAWQAECLTVDDGAVLAGGNLVYSAPTSAGKTLVAEILMMKRVFETQKKALLILPFVSLAREKMFHLQSVLRDAGVRVEGFIGSQSPAGGLKTTDIAVATIEKANSLINRLLEEGQLDSLSCVVVDELHMLGENQLKIFSMIKLLLCAGEQGRGYLLELLLTKVQYVAGDSVQIIGMSATLPNLSDLSQWLRASLYTTTFRPVPLTELIKIDSTLLDTGLRPVGVVRPGLSLPHDTDHLSWLCLETVLQSHSVLLFCPIKSWVENLSETISNDFFQVIE